MSPAGTPRLPRPERGLGPEGFYLEYLPQLFATLQPELPALGWSLEVDCRVRAGDDGGSLYCIHLGPERRLLCRAGHGAAALVEVSCSERAWQIGVRGVMPRLLRLLDKDDASRLTQALTHWQRIAPRLDPGALRASPGQIEIEFTDDAGDVATYLVRVAGGAGPQVQVALDDGELWNLLKSGAKLSQWLRSRVRIEGDAAYLVKLVRLLEAD